MKFILKLVGFVLIGALVALGALFFLPGERIARIAAERISEMTGREVTMNGDTSISFYPVLGISTGQTTIANADWATGGPMLSAGSLKVGIDPIALLRGEIRITEMEVIQPHIVIERDKEGRGNWQIGVDGGATSEQAGTSAASDAKSDHLMPTLDKAVIKDASVTYIDHASGMQQQMTGAELEMRWPDYEGEATFNAVLRPAGRDVRIAGRVGQLGPFLEGAVSPVDLTLTADDGTVTIKGRATTAPLLEGQLSADISSTASFAAALGLPAIMPPKGLGRSIRTEAAINLSEDLRVSLRDLALDLGGNSVTGAVDVVTSGARPRITAQLKTGALNLTGMTADGAAGAGGGTGNTGSTVNTDNIGDAAAVGEEGWSTAPIDASALGLADAEIKLTADSIDLGQFKFGAARILLTIDNSRAVAELQELQGYGGSLTGQVVANNRADLSVGGNVTADGIDMEALLTDAAGITRFATTGTASVDFLGSGQSVDAIMRSLGGNLKLSTGRGVISGFDLDRLMRTGDGSGGTTVFEELSASFAIKDGDMRGDDLTMTMPLATATGKGRIGLGARDIDYLFTPVLLSGENTKGLAIPVRIRGRWSSPAIRPDLEKAIDLNFREERKKLEKNVRKEVDREIDKFVEKELGVQVEDGQSVEDAIKEDVKKRAAKELFKLFK